MKLATALFLIVVAACTFVMASGPALEPAVIPTLPYHFVERPAPPPGTTFDNIASVALTAENHLIVLNRNPDRAMIEVVRGLVEL